MTFEIPDYDFDISQNEHPGYALAFAYRGTRDDGSSDRNLKISWSGTGFDELLMQPDLTANGDWEQAVICLPNYVADKNTTLSMVLNTSGSCQSNFNQDWYFDDFRLVPDATIAGFTAILGDGDFSRSLERQSGWPV